MSLDTSKVLLGIVLALSMGLSIYWWFCFIAGYPIDHWAVGIVTLVEVGAVAFALTKYGKKTKPIKPQGVLDIDFVNPNKDTYSFVLDCPIEDLANMDVVTFKVMVNK